MRKDGKALDLRVSTKQIFLDGQEYMGARPAEIGVEFWIHNPGLMSRKVQFQMFQRSFSTKGSGRGLGTYGAKLITEQYLKGGISFTSSAGEGTTFRAAYLIDLPS